MIRRRHVVACLAFLAAIACADHTPDLGEQYLRASLVLANQHLPDATNAVEARDGWILHRGELRYLNAGIFTGEHAPLANDLAPPEHADPTPAIIDFHRQLAQRGIELFFVPIPVRPTIYPESILGPEPFADLDANPNLHHSLKELLSVLRQNEVRVVDLTPIFLRRREHPKRGAVFYPSDTHWTPYGITLALRPLVSEIKAEPWFEAVPKHEFQMRWKLRMHDGGLYREYERATGKVREPDQIPMRRIVYKSEEGTAKLELSNPQSPVIVMGDSNTVRWSNEESALPHQLAYELGFPVDVLSAKGGGANETRLNLVRKIQADPDYLEGKRVVIWCFSARAFTNTEEGWIPIPLS